MESEILLGDCAETLKKYPAETFDCIVTDPPYGYSFMGKQWDKALPSLDTLKECCRVLKSGAFAFFMSAPRQDVLSRMIIRLEEAGFQTGFTSVYWAYATGFPKAANIGKLIDKRGTEQAKQFDGAFSGLQPKPAVEIIIVCMKPLSEKTYVDQALKNGHGVTWLSDCRIPCEDPHHNEAGRVSGEGWIEKGGAVYYADDRGRFPANLLVSDDCLNDGKTHKSGDLKPEYNLGAKTNGIYGEIERKSESVKGDSGSFSRYFDLDAWFKSKLSEQAQQTYPFMVVPKPSKSEKNKYCENKHPTVKPLKLMSYLITMGSREGDLILDPFAGSGTTLEAARLLNRKFVGCELTEEYMDVLEARAGVSITTDPYRNLIEITAQNEVTVEEMERALSPDESEKYVDLLLETSCEAFDVVRKAYWMGKGVKV